MQNAKMAQQVIAGRSQRLPIERDVRVRAALASAIITRPEAIPADVKGNWRPSSANT